MNTRTLRGLMLVCLILIGIQLSATIFYVTPTGTGTGHNWANASADLKLILDNALPGDEVWVAAGTYKPSVPFVISATSQSFEIKEGVAVYGGFNGTETNLEQRDFLNNRTILSGDLAGNDLLGPFNTSDNSNTVVKSINTSSATSIDGFIITSGHGSNGGGMFLSVSSILIKNCLFAKNHASSGGGLATNGGNPTLDNLYFIDNSSYQYGGGLSIGHGFLFGVVNSKATIRGCTFRNNSTTFKSGGGVIIDTDSAVSISNSRFIENSAGLKGGGLRILGRGEHTIEGCLFARNTSASAAGVSHTAMNAVYNSCLFLDNHATESGGGMVATRPAQVNNCGFLANEAVDRGGAYFAQFLDSEGGGTIFGSVFVGNASELGGGIFTHRDIEVINCSFSGNADILGEAAVAVFVPIGGTQPVAEIYNSISWSNTSNFGTNVTVNHSCVEGGFAGTGNIALDPQFISTPDPAIAPGKSGNVNLTATSPVIDAGNDALVPAGILLDPNGNNRFVGAVDMGAFEFQGTARNGNLSTNQLSLLVDASSLRLNWNDFNADLVEIYNSAGQMVYSHALAASVEQYVVATDKFAGMNYVILSGPSGVRMQTAFIP